MATLLIRDLEDKAKKEFHVLCVEKNSSMNAELKKLIAKFIQEESE